MTLFLPRLRFASKLLLAGILLRIVVFAVLQPLDNDTGHLDVIKYMVAHHALPPATANSQAFHPPLYYLLAAPVYAATGNLKVVQVLSLLLSILTLALLHRLIYVEILIPGRKPRLYAFLLACFLPQFVMYGLYVSNDALAIFLGVLLTVQLVRYLKNPDWRQLVLLSSVEGLGLLTKATFLAFLPVLLALVMFVTFRGLHSLSRTFGAAIVLLAVSCGLGGYKFIRNYRETGKLFFSSMDSAEIPNTSWVALQKMSYRGAASFFDLDLLKLVRSPSVSPITDGSYPLLIYGTLWYQHIPEPTFVGSRRSPSNYLGSVIYVIALVPSAVFGFGLFLLLTRLTGFLQGFDPARMTDRHLMTAGVSALFLLANVSLLIATVMKYHVWSLMQARLFFPAFPGFLLPFGLGAWEIRRFKVPDMVVKWAMRLLIACFALYFISEIGFQILLIFFPGVRGLAKSLSRPPGF